MRRFYILDTSPEQAFDEIAALLAETFEVPLAFVSLVDEAKVFFKAKQGPYEATEVPRDHSYCSLSILSKNVTVFEDTQNIEWTEIYPGFTPPKGLRFYAGAPIVTRDGAAIGTVCIADFKPKAFSTKEQRLLQQFARLALKEMENHRDALDYAQVLEEKVAEALQQLKIYEAEGQAFALYSQAPVAVSLYKTEELIVSYANETAFKISGKTPEVIGKRFIDVLPEMESQGFHNLLKEVYRTGKIFRANETLLTIIIDGQPKDFYFDLIYQPYYSANGDIEGVLAFGIDLTEQVLSRKAVEVSEQKFRNVLAQAPYPILIMKGEELRLEVANPPLFKLWGIDETSLGRPFLDILPEMKEQGFWDLLQKVYREGYIHYGYDSPVYFLRDGKQDLHYFNFVYHPYTEKDGFISGVLVLATDVTEQVLARKKAAESEANFRSLILQAPVGICILHRNKLTVEIANDRYAQMINRSRIELEGAPITAVLPIAGQYEPILYKVLDSGEPFYATEYAIELEDQEQNKKLIYVDFVYEPLRESDGSVNRVMALVIDVTEKVKARQQIEEMEARTRLGIEASEQGTFDVNVKTNEMKASRRLAEIFDVEDDADRHRYISAIHPDDLVLRENAYKSAYQTSILEYEGRVIKKIGFVIWVRVKGKIYFDENKEPERLVGIVQEITEHKNFSEALARKVEERTEELEQANKQLLAINDELQQFAYVSSHDLQEPLRKIRLYASLLSQSIEKEGGANTHLQKINASAERMSSLIHSLLEYSRTTNATPRFEELDLNDLLKTILTDYELLIEQKGATFEIGTLPVIEGVSLQMNQLFFNLIGNALKFTKRGVYPLIKISAEPLAEESKKRLTDLKPEKDYTIITIQDNGIGFDQAFASKIFTVFQRLNDRSSFGGYGIGLALCKKVVQAHKGLIFAEGELKKGAKFTVVLPLTQ
ncbi:PAS domain-containing protein [Flavisolibacter nicotianae]|uniref:PAS domain-containing protein n=1 Tax=Flavisolibacter nicotianae TaxID=2364882 RepID=UPI000EADBCE1|nr:PAS domain-containing protein [Flavisolibacter nicotianae]